MPDLSVLDRPADSAELEPRNANSFDSFAAYSDEEPYDEKLPASERRLGQSWTHVERSLAASLDLLESRDLSIQLYNAHIAKARQHDSLKESIKPWQKKTDWVVPETQHNVHKMPHASWTTWPLIDEEIATEITGSSVRRYISTSRSRSRPALRTGIEDELLACMMRRAQSQLSKPSQQDPTTNQKLLSPASQEHDLTENDILPDDQASQDELPAYVLIDDDEAANILSPSINHILAQFEELLLVLHDSRAGQQIKIVTDHPGSQKRQRLDDDLDRIQIEQHTASESIDVTEAPETAGEQNSSQEKQSRATRNRLAPRDWSEVLGLAALSGWHQSVIDRTARRCADLFDEHMSFKMLSEHADLTDLPSTHVQGTHGLPTPSNSQAESKQNDLHLSSLRCPVRDCKRNRAPLPDSRRMRAHLKRKHAWSHEQIERFPATSEPTPTSVYSTSNHSREGDGMVEDYDDLLAKVDVQLPVHFRSGG